MHHKKQIAYINNFEIKALIKYYVTHWIWISCAIVMLSSRIATSTSFNNMILMQRLLKLKVLNKIAQVI